jgi:transketolase
VLADTDRKPDVILLASGSEVQVALSARALLAEEGIQARVVAMPSWELFEEQPQDYRDSVVCPDIPARLAIEAGISLGWDRYVGPKGSTVSVDRFGASAPVSVIWEKFGFTASNVAARARGLLT